MDYRTRILKMVAIAIIYSVAAGLSIRIAKF